MASQLQKIFLISCGSYNPPTIMHLRIMEIARDYLHKLGKYQVIGGALSPVHDAYGKKNLSLGAHRIQMTKLALANHPWLKCSTWEAQENSGWTRTRAVIDYHQNKLDSYLNGTESTKDSWMPETLEKDAPVRCKIVCGADVLESFNIPNLWNEEDMETLARDYGLVVISREGNDPMVSIYHSDILSKHQGNIHLVREWIANEISSTRIRRAVSRNDSIKYLVPDAVIDYIYKEKLYKNLEK